MRRSASTSSRSSPSTWPRCASRCWARRPSAAWSTIGVHDLRQWTDDVHRTVDDAPYGGGPGMVMQPEPWGRALDAVRPPGTRLVVPTPAGRAVHPGRWPPRGPAEPGLVFACGRYEGIDQRVADWAARVRAGVRGLDRRLRARRRRVRRPGDGRGGHPAAARRRRQPRVGRVRLARRRAARGARRTPGRRPGAGTRCRRCCSPATTPRSPAGGARSRCGAPRPAVPTCWPRCRRTRSPTPSAPCSTVADRRSVRPAARVVVLDPAGRVLLLGARLADPAVAARRRAVLVHAGRRRRGRREPARGRRAGAGRGDRAGRRPGGARGAGVAAPLRRRRSRGVRRSTTGRRTSRCATSSTRSTPAG